MPLDYEVAELVLENMGGDFSAFRNAPVRYQARLVAAKRVQRMLDVAQAHDRKRRHELTQAAEDARRSR